MIFNVKLKRGRGKRVKEKRQTLKEGTYRTELDYLFILKHPLNLIVVLTKSYSRATVSVSQHHSKGDVS